MSTARIPGHRRIDVCPVCYARNCDVGKNRVAADVLAATDETRDALAEALAVEAFGAATLARRRAIMRAALDAVLGPIGGSE